jgi:hypothetical protein
MECGHKSLHEKVGKSVLRRDGFELLHLPHFSIGMNEWFNESERHLSWISSKRAANIRDWQC